LTATPDPNAREQLQQVLAEVLDHLSADGDAALARACADHPELAPALRQRVETLRRVGLLDAGRVALAKDPQADAIPEQLGEFTLLRRLGAGGMGVVFLAEQRSLKRKVALKLVRPDCLPFAGARERFLREVAVIAKLEHPNIVPVYSVGEERGIPFYAMQRIVGCSLLDVSKEVANRRPETLRARDLLEAVERSLRRDAETPEAVAAPAPSSPPPDESWIDACVRVVADVASALGHAHERGVLHRDVKPSNIMITRDGNARLVDFGLASSEGVSSLTRSGAEVGSLPYMAPEQIRGQPKAIDARTDLYQLGVTLFELLSLRLPYASDHAEELRRQILEGVPPPLRTLNRQVPWDVETVCLTAMERDASRRYASAAAFERDLRRLLARQSIEARRPGVWLRARRFAQRRPTLTVGAALGALIVVGGPVAYALFQDQANRDLKAEQALTSKQRDRADGESARAKENFRKLLAAMNELIDPLLDEKSDDLPEIEALRSRMLGRALGVYDGIDPTYSAEPELRRDLLRAKFQSALALQSMGRNAEAFPQFESAAAELERLLAAQPADEQSRVELAKALERLGAIRFWNLEFKEAEPLLRRSLEAFRGIPDERRARPPLRGEYANAWTKLLSVLAESGRAEESESEARALIAWLTPLAAAAPDDAEVQGLLADVHLQLGTLLALVVRGERVQDGMRSFDLAVAADEAALKSVGENDRTLRWDLAAAFFRRGQAHELNNALGPSGDDMERALQIANELRARFPELWTYSNDAGLMAGNLGAVRFKQGRLDDARTSSLLGVSLMRESVRRDAGDRSARATLFGNLRWLVDIQAARRDFDGALAACDEALALELGDLLATAAGTTHAWLPAELRILKWKRVEFLIELDDLDGAADAIDALEAKEVAGARDRARVAALFARCAAQARKSDESRAEGFEDEAFEQLQSAIGDGFKPTDAWLKDAALLQLAQRDDVRGLLEAHGVVVPAQPSSKDR